MRRKIVSKDGASIAIYCPRVGQWRVVEKSKWGVDIKFTASINEAVFVERGASWPGAVGYNCHARRISRPWGGYGMRSETGCNGAIKALRSVALAMSAPLKRS